RYGVGWSIRRSARGWSVAGQEGGTSRPTSRGGMWSSIASSLLVVSAGRGRRRGGARPSPGGGGVWSAAVGGEQLLQLARGQRAREVIALPPLAAHLEERPRLRLGLDSLRDRAHVQGPPELDDRRHEGAVARAVAECVDERAIDLEHVDREPMEV